MHTDLFDELSLRPLRRTDVDALVALGYGDAATTAGMVDEWVSARERGTANPMVIVRQCLAPDQRSFNGLRMTPLILGVISDLGDVWLAGDTTPTHTPA